VILKEKKDRGEVGLE